MAPLGFFGTGFTTGIVQSQSVPVYNVTYNTAPTTFVAPTAQQVQQPANTSSAFGSIASSNGPFGSVVSLIQSLIAPLLNPPTTHVVVTYEPTEPSFPTAPAFDQQIISTGNSSPAQPAETTSTLQQPGSLPQTETSLPSTPATTPLTDVNGTIVDWLNSFSLSTSSALTPAELATTTTQAYSPQHLDTESALSQEQSNLSWIQSQINAWQIAERAGLCGDTCQTQLAYLQSEVPGEQSKIAALTKKANAAPPTPVQAIATIASSSAPAGAPSSVYLTPAISAYAATTSLVSSSTPLLSELPEYTSITPALLAHATTSAPLLVSEAAVQFETPVPAPAPSATQLEENVVVQVLSSIVQVVQSWFAPGTPATAAATSSPAVVHNCSLFTSLFGGCSSI